MHILLYTKWQPPPCTSGGSWNKRKFALSSLCFLLILAKRLLWAKLATLWCCDVCGAVASQSDSHLVEAHGFTTEQQPSCWGGTPSLSLHNPLNKGCKELCTPQVKHRGDVRKWRRWLLLWGLKVRERSFRERPGKLQLTLLRSLPPKNRRPAACWRKDCKHVVWSISSPQLPAHLK